MKSWYRFLKTGKNTKMISWKILKNWITNLGNFIFSLKSFQEKKNR